MSSKSSSVSPHESGLVKRNIEVAPSIEEKATEVEEKQPKRTILSKLKQISLQLEPFIAPIVFTAIGAYVRFNKIDVSKRIVWDEAHFGKFGAYYLKHEFYHDVHPPLGKMLVGLSEWIAGYVPRPEFDFESGATFPEDADYKTMRLFNAAFSAACVPVSYYTAKALGLQLITTYLITLSVALESTYIALGKFILLDSILLFFTTTTFYTFIKVHTLKKQGLEFTRQWYVWMVLTGISIGCVCSVKWVGLFVTALVGLYTVHDLFEKLFLDKAFTWRKYAKHWIIRIGTLIIIPFLVYLISFKVHFSLLYKSGTGDASMSTLFQLNLENNSITSAPRTVHYGSEVTLRSHGLSPNLLHSHSQIYPEGSNQQQITGYGHSDGNNNWVFKYPRGSTFDILDETIEHGPITDGDTIRLSHLYSGVNLHSHDIPAHVSKFHREASGYGSEIVGDSKDNWIIEFVEQLDSANASYPKDDPLTLHPFSTHFRLRHQDLGCYLATTGASYPAWGFKQSEVVCKESWSTRDKSTWWNIEGHINPKFEIAEDYVPPRNSFWADFVLLNFAMASSNNALVPDEDKYDNLASSWWQWPTLWLGLRMCGWNYFDTRYYLIGNIFNTWGSSIALILFVGLNALLLVRYQRQRLNWDYDELTDFLIKGVYPFIGWGFHFLPFVIMGRVTYVHHYVPALFFAIFVLGFYIEYVVGNARSVVKYGAYGIAFALLIFTYHRYAPFHTGMTGNQADFRYLELLPTWNIVK